LGSRPRTQHPSAWAGVGFARANPTYEAPRARSGVPTPSSRAPQGRGDPAAPAPGSRPLHSTGRFAPRDDGGEREATPEPSTPHPPSPACSRGRGGLRPFKLRWPVRFDSLAAMMTLPRQVPLSTGGRSIGGRGAA
jgi:hypothetical protein